MRQNIDAGKTGLGYDNLYMFRARTLLAEALARNNDASPEDLEEAVNIGEDVTRRARRVLGSNHPEFQTFLRRHHATKQTASGARWPCPHEAGATAPA